MNDLRDIVKALSIPEILGYGNGKITRSADFEAKRDGLITLIENYMYGKMPKKPKHLKIELISEDRGFAAGRAPLSKYVAHAECEDGEVSFPFYAAIPKSSEKKPPVIIHLNFTDNIPDKFQPTEELTDKGFAVFTLCYEDVTKNNGDFRSGNARVLLRSRRAGNATGKIAMWAWALMRIVDYVYSTDSLDTNNIAVAGLGVLGKAALLASAYDERIKYTCANGAGVAGDAIIRGGSGECFRDLLYEAPFWFCPKFADFVSNAYNLPFDQHFLLSLIAPRRIIILTAENDVWSDPKAQLLSLRLAAEVYELYGLSALPSAEDHKGGVTELRAHCLFRSRENLSYFTRDDWQVLTDFMAETSTKRKVF
jgi:hypothetical protein